MAHIVVIGGFASSRSHLEHITTSLSEHWDEEVTGISFRESMEDGVKLEQLVRKARVFTHSAGMLAIKDTAPSGIVAIAPPLPTRPHTLVTRAGFSGASEVVGSLLSSDRRNRVNECARSATQELFLHLNGNLGRLGIISHFCAFETGANAADAGIAVDLAFMSKDKFFRPTSLAIEGAHPDINISTLEGDHDEFLYYPQNVIKAYEAAKFELIV